VIINQSSIERGLFRSVFYRTYKTEENLAFNNNSKTKICKPTREDTEINDHIVEKLDTDGIISPGTMIEGEEVLVGKVLMLAENVSICGQMKKHRESCLWSKTEKCVVDRVVVSENLTGNKFVKVKTRSVRIPQIGDKFASRHGQKGTCGMTFRQEDLPFTV
jgi:DNA-directed RNA polymerase II subunit RPB2